MPVKKDPNKFTVRFNPADPQQRRVIEILSQQGRSKAQFLTSAILHYICCPETPDIRMSPQTDEEAIKRIVRSVLSEQQAPAQETPPKAAAAASPWEEETPGSTADKSLDGVDRAAIFKTLNAFQQK